MTPTKRFFIGGIGAMMPVLVSIISLDVALSLKNPEAFSLVNIIGALIRYICLFFVGGFIAYLHSDEEKPFKLFEFGIAAPALITSIVAANAIHNTYPENSPRNGNLGNLPQMSTPSPLPQKSGSINLGFISSAYANDINQGVAEKPILLAGLSTELLDGFLGNRYQSQGVPQPIDLGIQNISQQTPVWCWAAVAQQIIYKLKGSVGTPQQCQLVAAAFNTAPQYCCQSPTPCMTTGSLQQIQSLIAFYGGHWSSIAPPASPMDIYQTLASGHAIIMAVQSSPYSGHVVVIRGMAWAPTPMGIQPVLYVNDPMAYFTQPIPFMNLAQFWSAAIVVF